MASVMTFDTQVYSAWQHSVVGDILLQILQFELHII